MNYPMAIVFSSALLVGSCVMNQQPAISQSDAAPKFQIVAAGPQSAWRLHTEKGFVTYCFADKEGKAFCGGAERLERSQ